MKEIEKRIQELKEEGKFEEAEYLENSKHQIDCLWQFQHLWIVLWRKHKKLFWGILIFLILMIMFLAFSE